MHIAAGPRTPIRDSSIFNLHFSIFILFFHVASLSAQPTLTFRAAPDGEVLQDSLLSFQVAPIAPGGKLPDSCGLWRSPVPAGHQLAGHGQRVEAARSIPKDSIGTLFRVRPSDSGASGPRLALGIHHLVAACGDKAVTPEIPVFVVSRRSASLLTPKSLETSSSPNISWSAVPGVPAYHLLLSDQPLEIDTEKGSVGGASIIWQAITAGTSIAYGTPDPSGNFAKVAAPPLSPGVTYNLVVLNNYDGRSALATSSKAQALKLFSIQAPADPLSKPVARAPAAGRILSVSSDSSVDFRWSASRSKAGAANSYTLYIYSHEEEEGSEILVTLFSGETTDTTLRLDAKRTLLSNRYVWKVFARGADGSSVAGDTSAFTYRNDVQTLRLSVRAAVAGGGFEGLGDVRVAVTPLSGGADALPLFTPSGGEVEKVLAQGGYALEFAKDGYGTEKRTVTLEAGGPLEVEVTMAAAAGRITGHAVDIGGLGLDNVKVSAASAEKVVSAMTDASGYFLLGVPAGSHAVRFSKADYLSPADTVVALKAGDAKDLGKSVLRRATGALSGTVQNDKGQPLSGCNVLIKTATGAVVRNLLTDDRGGFSALLAPGTYAVSASRTGFTTEEKSVRLADAAQMTLQLAPGASVLKGKVNLKTWPTATTPASSPLPDAALELRHAVTGATQKAAADLRGEFSFSADTGTYRLRASASGKARPESSLVKIDKVRSTVIKDMELEGFAAVRGTVSFTPALGANPTLLSVSLLKTSTLERVAQAAGTAASAGAPIAFALEGVPDGTYRLACAYPGYGLDAEPVVTITDGVWVGGLVLALRQATRFVTFNLRHGGQSVNGAVRIAAPQPGEARSATRIGPAAPGTWVLSADPDSLPLLPLSRFTFSLPATGAPDTALTLSFPFAHAPPADPLRFEEGRVGIALAAALRIDSAWVVHGYGAPRDTFRIPASQLGGFVGEPKQLRFAPGPEGGVLSYFLIVKSGGLTWSNDAPARRFRAAIEPSSELSFLRVSAGDSLPLPARSRIALAVHAYDAAGRRLDTAVEARGKVTWFLDDVLGAKALERKGRALTVETGSAPITASPKRGVSLSARGGAARGGAAAWDSLRVTVSLDGEEASLAVPALVVPRRVNRLVLKSSLGETPAIPSPARFTLFAEGFDTTTSPPTPLVPGPVFALIPPEAGAIAEGEVILDPRFIGPLKVTAVHRNGDGGEVATELGAARDSLLRGVNVGQTVGPLDSARFFVHDRRFEMRLPDSALAGSGQAVLRLYRRAVAKSFSSLETEALTGRLYEISNPSGAAFRAVPRINLGIPAELSARKASLARFESARLEWSIPSDSAVGDTTAFGDPSLAAAIADLDGSYYGLLTRSRPLTAGAVEILPNPFSPLVLASRDGNTEYGTRIRLTPESDQASEVIVSIRIYNQAGESIRVLADRRTVPKAPVDFYWDGKADGGRWARNGRYIVKITVGAAGSRETRHTIKPVVVFR